MARWFAAFVPKEGEAWRSMVLVIKFMFKDMGGAHVVRRLDQQPARPGTISGRTMQCGLKWGGFFEAVNGW